MEIHDVAVIDVSPAKTIVGEGHDLSFNMTLENQGLSSEIFNVTLSLYEINATSVNVELYGLATAGWGANPNNITSPGPTIMVNQWDHIKLTLHSADSLTHNFFVDYNGDQTPTAGEPTSPDFTSIIEYDFVADTVGTFLYYCHFHGSVMFGTLIVQEPSILSYYQESIPNEEHLDAGERRSSVRPHTCLGKGYYIFAAAAGPVPNEIETVDNTFIVGQIIFITIPGDVDGDRDVDIFDIVAMATIYGVVEPDPSYDPNCDIDGDGDVDIFDIVAAASHYGESW